MKYRLLSVIVGVLIAFSFASAQDADTLQPGSEGKDAYVDHDSPDQNYGDGVELWIGFWGLQPMDSFLEFDISAYAGRDLDSCFLDLWCHDRGKTVGVIDTGLLYAVAEAWQEKTITFSNRPSLVPGWNPLLYIDGNKDSWWTWDLKYLVNDWLKGVKPNYGMCIQLKYKQLDNYAAFHSSDGPYGPWRPRLRLYFKPQTSLTIVSPNGGENLQAGSVHNITWTSTGAIQKVKIIYTPKWSASQWYTIATDYNNTGSFAWAIPNTPGNEALVQVEDITQPFGVFDVSDGFFTISPLTVEEGKDKTISTLSLSVNNNPALKPVLRYTLPELSQSTLRIYSLDGREVRDLSALISGSSGTLVWDGRDDFRKPLPEGIYLCRLSTAENQESVRITLLRRGLR